MKSYLKFYNGIQLLAWTFALASTLFDKELFLSTILIFQTIALLEIYHVYKKWSNSSVVFTSVQTLARLYILFLIYKLLFSFMFYYDNNNTLSFVIYILLMAWCLAEIIRYAFYLSQLFEKKTKVISWLRYSAFIIIYPVGVCLEMYIIGLSFLISQSILFRILLLFSIILYFVMFPKLYTHLLHQRKKMFL